MRERGFSLVELMIIVAILGILAAIVVPQLQSPATEAKEAVAKDSLRILRSAIELYTAQHGGVPPGYTNDDPSIVPTSANFNLQMIQQGRYLIKMPGNPFSNLDTIEVIRNDASLPDSASGTYGWIYQPATKTILLDWPGADQHGIRYYDY